MRYGDLFPARLSLALVVSLLAIGCGGGAPPASQTPGSSQPPFQPATPVATDTLSEVTDPPATYSPPPEGNVAETFIAWLSGLGPGSPQGPTALDTYVLIRQATQQSCRDALNPDLADTATKALYHGAAAACLAALHGKQARWAEAEAAFDSLPGRPAGCVDQATFDLLESIVQAHQANPAAVFTREGQPAEGQPDRVELLCPTVSNVSVTRGPRVLEIAVEGTRLAQVLEIGYSLVDQCPLPPEFESPLRLEKQGDDTAIRATLRARGAAATASHIWIGVISEPYDWVAAYDCVPIRDAPPG